MANDFKSIFFLNKIKPFWLTFCINLTLVYNKSCDLTNIHEPEMKVPFFEFNKESRIKWFEKSENKIKNTLSYGTWLRLISELVS